MVPLLGACGNRSLSRDLARLIKAKTSIGDRIEALPVAEAPMRPGWATDLILSVLEQRCGPMRPGEIRYAIMATHGVQLGHSTVMRALRDGRAAQERIRRHPGSRYSLT